MYRDLVLSEDTAFHLAAGGLADAAYYPAAVPIRDRAQPGLAFELAPGSPWQWTGPGQPADVSLTDVLAATCCARLAGISGDQLTDLAALRAAHENAAQAAVTAGDMALAGRLLHEQAEVAVPALVSEQQAAGRLGITSRSLNNLRFAGRICPPVLIAGELRTKWFWAPAQFTAWHQARPGRAWRRGQQAIFPRTPCPQCGRDVAKGRTGNGRLRPHKRPGTTQWCPLAEAPGETAR